MKTVAIIQARMASTRLPGKVLLDLGGKPMLAQVVSRVRLASTLDDVVVATSTGAQDDEIADFCARAGITCVRGSEDDVLDRYVQAARTVQADVVVRITADCPLHDPRVIDTVVSKFLSGDFDYVSNTVERSYPDGLDTEVLSIAALERAWREASWTSEREHVTSYVWKNPDRFRIAQVVQAVDQSALRWTVDEPRDLALVREIYRRLGDRALHLEDVAALLDTDADLQTINAGIAPNEGYDLSVRRDRVATPGDPGMSEVRSGPALYAHARRRIPGGTQLLSKRPEMFLPGEWPSYFSRASGVTVWDLDGRPLVDMSHNAIGANVLGAADPDVDAAVIDAVRRGVASTLNAPEEVELADLLCELHPWAEMVRYARTGGEAMAMAVRIARARTRRDVVAFCGYHGWHDWYLAANLAEERALDGHLLPGLSPVGVPRGLAGTAIPFRYNHLDELEHIVRTHAGTLAAVVMEPLRDHPPQDGFLEGAKRLAREAGAVLVFDEITAGMRLTTGGAHLTLGVTPDVAVFAKAISNGYPMAAVVGTGDVMQAAQDSFISSTYWTDRIGPVAALATIRKHRRCDVATHLQRIGARVQAGWAEEGARAGLPIHVGGMTPLSHFHFDGEQASAGHTLFTQLMLDRGYLAGKGLYVTFAHTDAHVDEYLRAVRDVFGAIAAAWADGSVERRLRGPVAHAGFARLT